MPRGSGAARGAPTEGLREGGGVKQREQRVTLNAQLWGKEGREMNTRSRLWGGARDGPGNYLGIRGARKGLPAPGKAQPPGTAPRRPRDLGKTG